jgi:Holliday junction resolvase
VSTATKGRSFEHEIRELFRAAGYSVIRGAGSKGELFENKVDLVASRITRENEFRTYLTIVGIQCKAKRRR